MTKQRVDQLLVERGLAESRSQAQRLVMAGQVRVDGQIASKPSIVVPTDAEVEVDRGPRYVSRGGEKLEAALQTFGAEVAGRVCADVGASTGGFTDCLLQHGAARVYAIDVGQGILHWKLRQELKVVVMEGVNARHLDRLPEVPDMVTIDASFISLQLLLPVVRQWLFPNGGEVIALIKPQFEAGRKEAARGKGVIRDADVHQRVLHKVLAFAQESGFGVAGLVQSPLTGPKGNIEFFAHLHYPQSQPADVEGIVRSVIGAS